MNGILLSSQLFYIEKNGVKYYSFDGITVMLLLVLVFAVALFVLYAWYQNKRDKRNLKLVRGTTNQLTERDAMKQAVELQNILRKRYYLIGPCKIGFGFTGCYSTSEHPYAFAKLIRILHYYGFEMSLKQIDDKDIDVYNSKEEIDSFDEFMNKVGRRHIINSIGSN